MERMAAEESAAAPGAKRIARTKLERRKIVEESLLPGTSVTSVARAHGVRPNQVHHWRRLYRQGLLGAATTTALPRNSDLLTDTELIALLASDLAEYSKRKR